ncbi:unnamed protein product [Toxocara canis]|uniref:CASP-like protein n=1 Tax=Toxocara canis TaxID=6265 RepID=A0A183UAK5_TOXCA|nr:unnamed protein product [Toxocara canis]
MKESDLKGVIKLLYVLSVLAIGYRVLSNELKARLLERYNVFRVMDKTVFVMAHTVWQYRVVIAFFNNSLMHTEKYCMWSKHASHKTPFEPGTHSLLELVSVSQSQ